MIREPDVFREGKQDERFAVGDAGPGLPAPTGAEVRPRGVPVARAARAALVPVLAWAFGASVFFRDQLASSFEKIMGNDGDTRLLVLIHEHWLAVARGHEDWNHPNFYYPAKGVLGYSDTLLLNEVFYAPLRAANLDPFLAFQWTLIGLSAIGFASLYIVLRRYLCVSRPFAAAGCLLYLFANNMFVMVGHAQILMSWWTPVVALAGLAAATHQSRWVRMSAAACCGALAGLIVYSSFYIGWTTILATALIAALAGAARPAAALRFVRRRWRELLIGAGGLTLGAVPFILTYLPILREKGGRSYDEVAAFAPRPGELVNVGSYNYVWGATLRRLFGADDPRLYNGELHLSATPLLVAFSIVLMIFVLMSGRRQSRRPVVQADEKGRRSSSHEHGTTDPGKSFACFALVAAAALAILPLSVEGKSLWHVIWAGVPGASALRAINRMQIVDAQLIAVSFAVLLSRATKILRARQRRGGIAPLVLSVILGLVLIEQLHVRPSSLVDHSDQLELLEAVPAKPPSCSSFFVTAPAPSTPFYVPQLDAMLIASRFRIPTVNGYSGHTPADWGLNDPRAPGYLDAVRSWAGATGTTAGLCAYDLTRKTWNPAPFE